jgi:hypothetical protein
MSLLALGVLVLGGTYSACKRLYISDRPKFAIGKYDPVVLGHSVLTLCAGRSPLSNWRLEHRGAPDEDQCHVTVTAQISGKPSNRLNP